MISLVHGLTRSGVGPSDSDCTRLVTIECHGALVGVRSNDDAAIEEFRRRLPPGARLRRADRVAALYSWRVGEPDASGRVLHVVSRQCAEFPQPRAVARTSDMAGAVVRLVHDIEFRVAIYAPDQLFVHAAAVAWQGRVIVLPGRSFAGKSTLTTALIRASAVYFSDEYTVIDEKGLVHPFPRVLHVRSANGGRSTTVNVDELGGEAGSSPLPIGLIVATAFREGARWRPRLMSPGQAALTLFDNAIVGRTRPAHTMTRIARALERGGVGLRGVRGEADEVAGRLLGRATRTFTAGYATSE